MIRRVETGIIVTNEKVAPDHYVLEIELPSTFEEALPGQFVMVKIGRGETPLLARPFSVYGMHTLKGNVRLEILYRIAGKGTRLLASLNKKESLGVLGPLGQGFQTEARFRKVALVAGGVGVAPLTYLARFIGTRFSEGACEITGYIGAKTESCLVGLERLEKVCGTLRIATDDGSRGFQGMVTDLFKEDLRVYAGDDAVIYTCGPHPMLFSIANIIEGGPWRCQVSMEERMACGLGACLGCAIKAKSTPGFLRVCTEGPVFNIEEIDWND